MNLEDAIKHCEEVADEKEICKECAEEHRQLAEWLKDYKRLKEQKLSKDIEEIKEVINCDADAETKCKMISNILTAKPHYFKEQEPTNKIVQKAYEDGKKDGYVQAKLEQKPTVTSTNNSGEMIYPQVEGITPTVVNEDIYECSCGYGWDKNKKIRFHFCPNCGKAVGDGNDYKYIKSISNPTGIEFDIDIPKKIESYEKLLKHPVVKHIMDMDEEQEQIDFVRPHKKIPVTLTVSGYDKLIDLANAIESDDSGYWTNKKISSALRNISFIKPQLCEDTISRQTVMDYIHRILNQGTGKKKSFEFIQKYVEKLPSIKPQVQTGHWEIANSFCTCDQCGYETRPWNNTLFCPNCGARMESEKNE